MHSISSYRLRDFERLFNHQPAQFATRLDQVVEAHFNTTHAALEQRNAAAVNQRFMTLAHQRGLKVQLYSWNVPLRWRDSSKTYWAKTLEAEDSSLFTHPIGEREGDGWHANTARHTSGLLLDTPSTPGSGIRLRYAYPDAHYGLHIFWMKTDDISGTDRIAILRILRHSDGTVLGTQDVLKSQFDAVDTYQEFAIRYSVPAGGESVRYQIDWTGAGNLWVDKIRAHDNDSNEDGRRLWRSCRRWLETGGWRLRGRQPRRRDQ